MVYIFDIVARAEHKFPKGGYSLRTHTIRKKLAGLISIAMVAGMLFPAPSMTYAQETPPLEQVTPKLKATLSPQLPIRSLSTPSSLRSKADIFVAQSDSDEPVTVIVELETDPVALHEANAKNSIVPFSGNHEKKIRSEHAAFKMKAESSLNVEFNHEYTTAFNGYSVRIPANEVERLAEIPGVKAIYPNLVYSAPPINDELPFGPLMDDSAPHIGANKLWDIGVTGRGIKIGVLDTGIDMNHPSLKGAYKEGWDFVDNDPTPMETLPDSTKLPLKDGTPYHTTHGTHVSGTIAGRGNPDDPNSPTGWVKGVAPGAELYVYRVLGPYGRGSTDNITAAIDTAVGENLDVINLSLGVDFNNAYTADSVAVNNAVAAGVTVVLANGNAGPKAGTVGSPGGAHLPISVGASTPPTITPVFDAPGLKRVYAHLSENAKEITEQGKSFEMVYANYGKAEDYKGKDVAGKLVLVSRGGTILVGNEEVGMTFGDKAVNAAQAGAAALIIFNNVDGELKATLGDPGEYIPTYSVSKDAGLTLKGNIERGVTTVAFSTIEEQDLLADFSSRGPVYPDYTIKPDISAPGVAIRSSVPAWDGNYEDAYKDSQGTSMAAPHIAGAAALLLEKYHHRIRTNELKSLMMNNAVPMYDRDKAPYLVMEQGAGRVDLNNVISAKSIAMAKATTTATKNKQESEYETGSVSFGLVGAGNQYSKSIKVKDIANEDQSYSISIQWNGTDKGLKLSADTDTVTVSPNGENTFDVNVMVPANVPDGSYEGFIILTEAQGHVLRLPVSLYVGDKYEIDTITNITTDPVFFSPNGESTEQTTKMTFAVTRPIEDFTISVTDSVYGHHMGDVYVSKDYGNMHDPDIYGIQNWNGTVKKDGQSVTLPDGKYDLVPVIGENKLEKQKSWFIIDRQAPESVMDEDPVRIDEVNPGQGIISGKVTKDLLIDLLPNEPVGNNIFVTAIHLSSGDLTNGTVNNDGTFTISAPLNPGMNNWAIYVYDAASNGVLAPAHHVVFDNKDKVYAGSAKSEVLTGEPFDVKVNFSVPEAVYSASFSLTYDRNLTLEKIEPSVVLATYQQKHHPDVPLIIEQETSDLDNGMKKLDYSVRLTGGAYEGAGAIASITFSSNKEGTYTFNLTDAKLLNVNEETIPIEELLSATIKVIKPTVPNPKPGTAPSASSSGSSAFAAAVPAAGSKLKAGTLTETKKGDTVNAVLKVDVAALKKQLQDKDAKQAQLDLSDVQMKKYGEVSLTLEKSAAQALSDSGKGLLLSAADFDVSIPNKAIAGLIGNSGFELVLSLADHKEKGFSKDQGKTTFTAPKLTIHGPKEMNTALELTLKLDTAALQDIRKIGAYAQDARGDWNYEGIGTKAKDGKAVTFKAAHFGAYTIAEQARSFLDIAAHWAKDEVEVIAAHELLRGKDGTDTFKPNDMVTQAEFATLLDRLTDTGKTWEDRITEPGARDPLTRQQMVVMLAQALGADLSQFGASLGFKDEALISKDAKAAVVFAVSKGLIKGINGNKFDPAGTSTRAQAALILYRVMNLQ
ncbi:S8 family serine peptidase [Paenibacillus apiarius]|uniref:S8 family serine peptidase n=1 Tax=Paenibacillus apiarius TaxID=46240 RepID=A0ABT4DQL5_9BACL|nr:S8 family serine peptidase [Paenibacillus apiarius]MCY9513374.1 S8 family serine peptidase [Paenibacillus apiarius]MCY9519654.1 S8 family serine peptidase [Paenibacillus apiarius]MCY9553290.1 S8 family serine peptidase [Paenibacillus apiarius]MCY9557140.1 S8 family serine peptidase [Paenibacillus apiarius]MCY9682119.1 S8 family serine peptidase [Paenibacillus apiarius]